MGVHTDLSRSRSGNSSSVLIISCPKGVWTTPHTLAESIRRPQFSAGTSYFAFMARMAFAGAAAAFFAFIARMAFAGAAAAFFAFMARIAARMAFAILKSRREMLEELPIR